MNNQLNKKFIFKFLYKLFHLLYDLLEIIFNILKNLINSRNEIQLNDIPIKYFEKLPKHIAFGINEQFINYEDIKNLIKWCQHFDVNYVSLFRSNGISVSHNEIENCFNGNTINQKNGLNESKVDKNGFNGNQINGKLKPYLTLDKTKICIVTSDDSRQSIVNAAKHLSSEDRMIDTQDISEYLKKNYEFPDPDLLISFGPSKCLYGYPLWQLRLSEIYFLPTHRNIKLNQFYDIIRAYSKCEQRFGK